jgi:NAD(P)H-flavin reductase
MEARIREKQEVAKGTLMVTFDLLGNEVDFRPGQYFYVTLPDVGYQDEKGLRRHITVVTSPNDRGCTRPSDEDEEQRFQAHSRGASD